MNLKHIRLVRIDKDAEEVNISLGEAVIGRGDLLGCKDKRVSRNHGVLRLTESGTIILKAQHHNPVFYTAKNKPSEVITSGNSVVLNNDDEFALLPDSYQFRVTVLPEIETQCDQNSCTKTDSPSKIDLPSDSVQIKEEPKEPEQVKEPEPVQTKEPELVKSELVQVKQELENGLEDENQKEEVNMGMDSSSSLSSRTRTLPSWMTDSSNDASKAGTSKGARGGRKRNDNAKNDKAVANKKARVNTKKLTYSDDDTSDKDVDRNGKNVVRGKLHELSDEEEDSVTAETKKSPAKRNHGGRKRSEKAKEGKSDNPQGDKGKDEDNEQDMVVDSSDETNPNNGTRVKLHELSDEEAEADTKKQDDLPTVQNNSDDEQSNDASNNAASPNGAANNSRQKCLYGAKCYRKNPQHRIDFSHPGDVDYDDDDLPECPYGTACYRKNKQHRLDYKHTAAPQQANRPQTKKQQNTQKRKTRKDVDYEDDEEDDYDFDDPFLNDASSDDYQPTDSGSDSEISEGDDEDTKRMLKESKRFTRQRK